MFACIVMCMGTGALAAPTVLNFDDLSSGVILSGGIYAGLTWEDGNAGLVGFPGKWAVPTPATSHPFSQPHNLINGNGATLMSVSFANPVDLQGAYVAVQGSDSVSWAQSLRVHGYFGGLPTTDTPLFTQITTIPTWFDMTALTHVDRIVFEASVAFENQAYYGIDDLTFTYIPEPAGISLGLLALGGVLLRRSRCS
jgi:hypothetical protein